MGKNKQQKAEAAILTTSEVAAELGTDSKTLRKFFRSDACDIEPVGQGKRYAITSDMIDDLRESFEGWGGGKGKAKSDAPKADKPKKAGKKKERPTIVEDDEDEPTEEDLAELEDIDLDDIEEL